MTDMVNHPPHYEPMPGVDFDCITVVRHLSFSVGNAVKYVWRADRKNGREDIEKARWYMKDAINYATPVYTDAIEERYLTDELLQIVAEAQTNELRERFFTAIRFKNTCFALRVLDTILAETPA